MALRVAVVIPAWQEADAIGAVLAELPRSLVHEVYVVIGGPTDPTGPAAAQAGAHVVVPYRSGYGAACSAGTQAAREAGASVVAYLDGDYSDPPGALGRVLAPLLAGNADLVLGWRDFSRYPESLPLHARVGNRLVLGMMPRPHQGPRLLDLPSYKALRLDQLDALRMQEMTFGWTVEMLVKAVRAGLRVAQVPVEYRPRLAGRSKVSGTFRGSLGAAWKLTSCALRYGRWVPAA